MISQTLLLPRDWLDQLTTHAYTAAPDIVLCGNKVLFPSYQNIEDGLLGSQ